MRGSDAAVLRLVHDMHEIMQPAKGEEDDGGGGAQPARFVRGPSGAPEAAPPAGGEGGPAGPGSGLVDREGQEYVSGE